jgi:demethylspheroidene O-methyltransferase
MASVPARSWSDRWFAWRNRLLASPDFRRRAAAFWPTRAIARRRAADVFDLVAGFVYSQVLLACVRLDLFTLLAAGPQTTAWVAMRTGLAEPAVDRLLAAAVSLQLAERRPDGRYGLGVLGASLVGNDGVLAMVEHHAELYADLADPVALLAGAGAPSRLGQYWAYAKDSRPDGLAQEQVQPYSALMSASQPLVADEILDAYPMARHQCVLDVGGGEGTFLLRVARRVPLLRLHLADLPAVAARAERHFALAGLGERAVVWGGNFLADPLPKGADLATLVRVVHDHDDANALRLLKAVREALQPGGTLLLAEPMAGTAGAQPMGDAYFGFYLLAMGSGRPRTAQDLAQLMEQAGFEQVRTLRTRLPLQTGLLSGKTPVNSS